MMGGLLAMRKIEIDNGDKEKEGNKVMRRKEHFQHGYLVDNLSIYPFFCLHAIVHPPKHS